MKRSYAIAILALSALTLVSSHSAKRHVDHNISIHDEVQLEPSSTTVFTIEANHVDMAFLNDAVVPVVQPNPQSHVASTPFVAEGYQPAIWAIARGPTEVINLITPARDQLRC